MPMWPMWPAPEKRLCYSSDEPSLACGRRNIKIQLMDRIVMSPFAAKTAGYAA